MPKITEIKAREILSTSSKPSIEVKITLDDGTVAKASAPYGSSDGAYEPVTLVDGDESRYHGKGMLKAVTNVNEIIAPKLSGTEITNQSEIDYLMRELDGTPNLAELGGNAVTCVSLAVARAASVSEGKELFEYLELMFEGDSKFPQPMMVVIEGGAHAEDSTDFQEYLIVCHTDGWSVKDWVREGIETYQTLKTILKEAGYGTNVGTEGAFAPTGIKSNAEPFDHITKAIEEAGYKIGEDISLALDAAASEVFKNEKYELEKDSKNLSAEEMIAYHEELLKKYSLLSIEDGLGEDDWENWIELNKRLGDKTIVMGDDLTVTNKDKLQEAIDKKAMNAILIKPNQAGTLTDLVETVNLAKKNDLKIIVSHRGGGETGDTFLADLAYAAGADMFKVGPSRSERVEKYNRLMEIEDLVSGS